MTGIRRWKPKPQNGFFRSEDWNAEHVAGNILGPKAEGQEDAKSTQSTATPRTARSGGTRS